MKEMSLWSVRGVNPPLHKRYRRGYYEDKDTLNRIYSDQLSSDLYFLSEVLNKNIELEGDIDLEDYIDNPIPHSHELKRCNDIILRKNETNDLTRLNLRNMTPESIEIIEMLCKKFFGGYHGKRGHIVNMAMNLSLKMRKGVISVAKNSRSYAKRVLNGDVISPLHDAFNDFKEEIRYEVNRLGKIITESKPTILPRKAIKKAKKLDKTIKVLDEVKKVNQYDFTRRDYKNTLINVFGQGDDRTVNSDLEMLTASEMVVEERMIGYNGTMNYRFKDNELYDKYQGPHAMRAFIEKFKDDFKDHLQTTKKEIESFIQRVTGLNDTKSIVRRLDVLLTSGYLTSFGESNKVFDICIN